MHGIIAWSKAGFSVHEPIKLFYYSECVSQLQLRASHRLAVLVFVFTQSPIASRREVTLDV